MLQRISIPRPRLVVSIVVRYSSVYFPFGLFLLQSVYVAVDISWGLIRYSTYDEEKTYFRRRDSRVAQQSSKHVALLKTDIIGGALEHIQTRLQLSILWVRGPDSGARVASYVEYYRAGVRRTIPLCRNHALTAVSPPQSHGRRQRKLLFQTKIYLQYRGFDYGWEDSDIQSEI
jgi:hypothetical protein